jgi:hypothetical protein
MPRRPDIRGQRHGDRHHFSHIFFHVKMVYTQIPLIPWKNMEDVYNLLKWDRKNGNCGNGNGDDRGWVI